MGAASSSRNAEVLLIEAIVARVGFNLDMPVWRALPPGLGSTGV